MSLEIIATNLTDAIKAEEYGADRIELSPSMMELGITPSYGLIKSVLEVVTIPINVIIRPHSQSFIYNKEDVSVMEKDIQLVNDLGANGIVVGPLTTDGIIDEEVLKQLLDKVGDMDVTIHKAFDFIHDQEKALECLSKYPQVKLILTSGGSQSATEVPRKIQKLTQLADKTHLKIMVGGGLREDNFQEFYAKVKPNEIHFGSGVRVEESYLQPIDKNKVRKITKILNG